jgi:soluble lytic murein transglycosylase-like protein
MISYKIDERGLVNVTTDPGNVQWGTPTLAGAELAKFWAMVGQWRELVDEASLDYGVPSSILFAVMHGESGGNAAAVSKAGALGLMQVMPFHFTAAERPLALDPRTNIRKGAAILKGARAGGQRDLVEVASMYDAGGPKSGGPWTNAAWLAAGRNPTHTTRWGYAGEPGYLDRVVAASNAFILGGEA